MAFKRRRSGFRRRGYGLRRSRVLGVRRKFFRRRRLLVGRKLNSRWRRRGRRVRRISMRRLPADIRPEVKSVAVATTFAKVDNSGAISTNLFPFTNFPAQGTGAGQRIGNKIRNYLMRIECRNIRIGNETISGGAYNQDLPVGIIPPQSCFRVMVIYSKEARSAGSPGIIPSDVLDTVTISDMWQAKYQKPSLRNYKVLFDRTYPLVRETQNNTQVTSGTGGENVNNVAVLMKPRTFRFSYRVPHEFSYDPTRVDWVGTHMPLVWIFHNVPGTSYTGKRNVLACDLNWKMYYTDA